MPYTCKSSGSAGATLAASGERVMVETLIQPCRVCEEGLRVVKHFQTERNRAGKYPAWMTVP